MTTSPSGYTVLGTTHTAHSRFEECKNAFMAFSGELICEPDMPMRSERCVVVADDAWDTSVSAFQAWLGSAPVLAFDSDIKRWHLSKEKQYYP